MMAKKGKHVGKQHYEPKYSEDFKKFMKPQKEVRTLCGFKLKNINQIWNWKTLQDINL